jgi:hypothetical protein
MFSYNNKISGMKNDLKERSYKIKTLISEWPSLQERFDPHTIFINADNGREKSP